MEYKLENDCGCCDVSRRSISEKTRLDMLIKLKEKLVGDLNLVNESIDLIFENKEL